MNCLSHALTRWHEQGGALRIVRSTHWGMPHVLHEAQDGTVTHYVPQQDLDKPVQSLIGFAGEVRVGDDVARGPMPLHGIVLGAVLLLVGACGWALGRMIRGRANG